MTASDAQIEIAILASIERQANRTAAALQRVLELLGEVEEKLDEIAGTLAAAWNETKEERGAQ